MDDLGVGSLGFLLQASRRTRCLFVFFPYKSGIIRHLSFMLHIADLLHLLVRRHHSLRPRIPRLGYGLTSLHPLVPRPGFGVLLAPFLLKPLAHDVRLGQQQPMPRHEHEIRVRALVANQVLLSGLLEVAVDDAQRAADLVAVAVKAGG